VERVVDGSGGCARRGRGLPARPALRRVARRGVRRDHHPVRYRRLVGTVSGSGGEGGELRLAFGHDDPQIIHVDTPQRSSAVVWRVLAGAWLPDWLGTTISFELAPDQAEGCQLKFRHRGLTPKLECYDSCKVGWDHFLRSLGVYVETGEGTPWESDLDTARRETSDRPRLSPTV